MYEVFFLSFLRKGGQEGVDDTLLFIFLCGHAETDGYMWNVSFGVSWIRD